VSLLELGFVVEGDLSKDKGRILDHQTPTVHSWLVPFVFPIVEQQLLVVSLLEVIGHAPFVEHVFGIKEACTPIRADKHELTTEKARLLGIPVYLSVEEGRGLLLASLHMMASSLGLQVDWSMLPFMLDTHPLGVH
jgi:hypothetical protein